MSVEVWQGDELLGLASERIGEYIDNLGARIEALMRGLKCYGVHGHYCGYITDGNEPNGSPDIVGKCTCGLDALLSLDDPGGKLPWETTEACAEALREQLAARVEDAERIKELEAANARVRMPGYLWERIRRLHRWLRKARRAKHDIYTVLYARERRAEDAERIAAASALAAELAVALKTLLTMTWPTGGPLRDAAVATLKRYDATKEDPDGR